MIIVGCLENAFIQQGGLVTTGKFTYQQGYPVLFIPQYNSGSFKDLWIKSCLIDTFQYIPVFPSSDCLVNTPPMTTNKTLSAPGFVQDLGRISEVFADISHVTTLERPCTRSASCGVFLQGIVKKIMHIKQHTTESKFYCVLHSQNITVNSSFSQEMFLAK